MNEQKVPVWGMEVFRFTKGDVIRCVDAIEKNKFALFSRGVSQIYTLMRDEFEDGQQRDPVMLIRWIEKILHLHAAGVRNIPEFLCGESNHYRLPTVRMSPNIVLETD